MNKSVVQEIETQISEHLKNNYNPPTRVYLGYLSYCLLMQELQLPLQLINTYAKSCDGEKVFDLEIYHCSDDKNHIYVC